MYVFRGFWLKKIFWLLGWLHRSPDFVRKNFLVTPLLLLYNYTKLVFCIIGWTCSGPVAPLNCQNLLNNYEIISTKQYVQTPIFVSYKDKYRCFAFYNNPGWFRNEQLSIHIILSKSCVKNPGDLCSAYKQKILLRSMIGSMKRIAEFSTQTLYLRAAARYSEKEMIILAQIESDFSIQRN